MRNNEPLSLDILSSIFRTSPKDPSRIINREGTTIEFKESYNNGSMAQYFRAIASFANNSGGYVLFGVGDKPRCLLGLKEKSLLQFEELKTDVFTKNLQEYFSPEIKWDHCTFEYREMSFGVIYVYPLIRKPCICKKHYDDPNPKYTLKEGDIYYRYGGKSERMDFGYLVTKKYNEHDYKEELKEYGEIDSEESVQARIDRVDALYRETDEYGHGRYHAGSSGIEYGGEDLPLLSMDQDSTEGRGDSSQTERDRQGSLRDQRGVG